MASKIRQPGWYRALAFSILGVLVCLGLSTGLRAAFAVDPVYDGESVLQISLLMVPFFFLGGIGCFDYWLRWAAAARSLMTTPTTAPPAGRTTSSSTPTTR